MGTVPTFKTQTNSEAPKTEYFLDKEDKGKTPDSIVNVIEDLPKTLKGSPFTDVTFSKSGRTKLEHSKHKYPSQTWALTAVIAALVSTRQQKSCPNRVLQR